MRENIKLFFAILKSQASSLFFILLVISAGVSFFLGEFSDGMIISIITLINTVLAFIQEFKASRASEKLLSLVAVKSYVLREGRLVQVLTSEIVLGDMVHLTAGGVAPVDMRIEESVNALIDESVRTGETLPKNMQVGDILFAGSVVAAGKIIGSVIAIGAQSSISKYKDELEGIKKWSSFNLFVARVAKYIFAFALAALSIAFIFLVIVQGKYAMTEFFVFAIALLVGVVPEALPLIITLIMSRESLELSKQKVIVKRLSSLQELGAVQFLLTDKTGTITENTLQVATVRDFTTTGNETLGFWQVSNSISEGQYERSPMDTAYDDALNGSVGKLQTPPAQITTFEPFTNTVGYAVFHLANGDIIVRGQIEKVVALCRCAPDPILTAASAFEQKGMRVIALSIQKNGIWIFVGFAAFHDPIKASAQASVQRAHKIGVNVKILTGDSEAVATNVAEALGLISHPDNVISLSNIKISALKDTQLRRAIVFAKCTPENKLELMDRYIKLGPVAYLGDGINDALALKRADIGIAVDTAADIAKQSADVILLEKDLGPILEGVVMGKKALRNVLTYIMYTLSGNAGTFFSLLVASFFYTTLPMLPIQILLNNIITDLPLMMIITDNPDSYALSHVPHYEPKKIMKRVFIFGILSSIFDLIYFHLYSHASTATFQTGWFVLSVLTELVLVLSIRSSRPLFKSPALSMPLAIGLLTAATLPFIFVYVAPLAHVFQFIGLSLSEITKLAGIVLVYVIVNETAKYFMRRRNLFNKPLPPAQIFKN